LFGSKQWRFQRNYLANLLFVFTLENGDNFAAEALSAHKSKLARLAALSGLKRGSISSHIFRFHLARAVTLKPGKSAILFLPTKLSGDQVPRSIS
jgi:hypothetical protein